MDEPAPEIVLLGAGGHARVLVDALRAAEPAARIGVLDTAPGLWGTLVLDAPVIGGDPLLGELVRRGTRRFAVALGGTRDNGPRRRLFEHASSLGLQPVTIVHPRAIVSAWAQVGAGAQILAGAVVNAGAVLGVNVIVNTGAIVEHDCAVGDHAHLATGARLAGAVRVGAGAHVGAGAVVLQSITIGADAVVGAGAVVIRDVPGSAVVAGVPAKELSR